MVLIKQDLKDKIQKSEYIVGTQSSSTSAWTGNALTINSLRDGQVIYYKLPYASTSTAVTLNLTLADGSTTGAKEVWFWNGQRLTTHYGVNSVVGLVYNGTQWWVINPSSNGNNNNYYLYQQVTITNGDTNNFASGHIVGAKKDGKYYKIVSGMVLDVSYPIVEVATTMTANTSNPPVSNLTYLIHPFLALSGINVTYGTITANMPLYLEGTAYSNGQFTVSNNSSGCIVCDNSTHSTLTNGRYYIRLGTTYDATHFRFVSDMTVYRWDGTNKNMIPIGTSYNDLSNKPSSFTPSSHTHGNITNDGKIGSTANKPLITTSNGTITTGNFGGSTTTTANYFVACNDSRLSDARTPTAHNQATTTITNSETYSNLGSNLTNQKLINDAINTKIGTLSSIKAIEVVASKPTASASTMNKLYIVSENNKVNVYYTKQSGSTYTLEKMDEDILDELSIAWNDITGKPTIDTTVANNANNLVTSKAVYDGLSGKVGTSDSRLTDTRNPKITVVANGTDLNTLRTAGFYYNSSNAGTTNITNMPNNIHMAFTLLVESFGNNTFTKQTLTFWDYDLGGAVSSKTYIRTSHYTNNVWTKWQMIKNNDPIHLLSHNVGDAGYFKFLSLNTTGRYHDQTISFDITHRSKPQTRVQLTFGTYQNSGDTTNFWTKITNFWYDGYPTPVYYVQTKNEAENATFDFYIRRDTWDTMAVTDVSTSEDNHSGLTITRYNNFVTSLPTGTVQATLNPYYAQVSHTHTKSQITDFPTSMTPTAHTNATASNIGQATGSVFGHLNQYMI